MSDLLSFFGDDEPSAEAVPAPPRMMTESQRAEIRNLFAQLNVGNAREQFAMVAELTGEQISSVSSLEAPAAQTLIHRLRGKVQNVGRMNTGNAWDDRDEDTWIDRL